MTFVPPELNNPTRNGILLVGRDPGEREVADGRPFVGRAGELLGQVLSFTSWRREDVNIANVVGYRPPNNVFRAHDPRRVQEGIEQLHQLARRLQPRLIIAMGNEACHALIPGWPGNTIFQAKDITERRGYFFDTPFGWVLAALHPAGVLRKAVPGEYLMQVDFKRAKRWLAGQLPRESFPEPQPLRSHVTMQQLMAQRLLGWDVETKRSGLLTHCGFCGDDRVPYVATGRNIQLYGYPILASETPKVGHNAFPYDLAVMQGLDVLVKRYDHDTMQMWHAIEPELAGRDDSGGEEHGSKSKGRMTRKGLAFLASVYGYNLPWWKCLEENTPVLMADLTWKPVKDVQVGDYVLGFDEHSRAGKRRYRKSRVVARRASRRECVKIATTEGSLVLTPDHLVLIKTKLGTGQRLSWIRADSLKPGDTMCSIGAQPWATERTREAGYLAGFFDGEGSIQADNGSLMVSQNAGPELDAVKTMLQERGYDVRHYYRPRSRSPRNKQAEMLRVGGPLGERLRFLGSIRPERLLRDFWRKGWRFTTRNATVIAVRKPKGPGGAIRRVVDIATTTRTFIANGLAVHNCYPSDEDPDWYPKMTVINANDSWFTRDVADVLLEEIAENDIQTQYEESMLLAPVCLAMQSRGFPVDNTVRKERIKALKKRRREGFKKSASAALAYIKEHQVESFADRKKCPCCGGGKRQREHCWRCSGLSRDIRTMKKPELLDEIAMALHVGFPDKINRRDAENYLEPCTTCAGEGKVTSYHFNPQSTPQMRELLYETLHTPRAMWKNKVIADETALRGVLRWAKQ